MAKDLVVLRMTLEEAQLLVVTLQNSVEGVEKVLRAERDPIRLQFLGRYLPTFKRLRDSLAASMKATGSPM